MDLKTSTCTLVLLIIACSLSVVRTNTYQFHNSSSSSWSSSSSSGSVPSYPIKSSSSWSSSSGPIPIKSSSSWSSYSPSGPIPIKSSSSWSSSSSSGSIPIKSSSSWSSSSSSGPIPIQGYQFANGSQSQPGFVYVKTINGPITSQQSSSEWSSKSGLLTSSTSSYRNYTLNSTRTSVIINIPTHISVLHVYVQPKEYNNIISSHVLLSLRIAQRFRYNAIFILGYLLQSPESGLNLQQYASLKVIYNALQRKEVHMYRLLSALIQVQRQSRTTQLTTLMTELSKYLPQYYSCSAAFWTVQIRDTIFKIDTILMKKQENFDLFANITETDIQVIQKNKVDDEMEGYDRPSKITESLIGRVFVKIFKMITVNKLYLSQQLFAIILSNLPNPQGDVVFEEYVEYVAEVAWRNGIPNWEQKQTNPNCIEPYALITMMTERIVGDIQVSFTIKQALIYIKNHFVNQRNYVMTAQETYRIIEKGGLDITYLLSIITIQQFGSEAVMMKNFLLQYSQTHYTVIQSVLRGLNKYGYLSTQDLLIVFLTRLRLRLPDDQVEIHKTVTVLLSTVQVKVNVWHVSQVTSEKEVVTPQFGDVGYWPTPAYNGTEPQPKPEDHKKGTPIYGVTTPQSSPDVHRTTTPASKGTKPQPRPDDHQKVAPIPEMTTIRPSPEGQLTTTPASKGTKTHPRPDDHQKVAPIPKMTTIRPSPEGQLTTTPASKGTKTHPRPDDHQKVAPIPKMTTIRPSPEGQLTTTPASKGTKTQPRPDDHQKVAPIPKMTTIRPSPEGQLTTTPASKGTKTQPRPDGHQKVTPVHEATTTKLSPEVQRTTTPATKGTKTQPKHGEKPKVVPVHEVTTPKVGHVDNSTTTTKRPTTDHYQNDQPVITTTPLQIGSTPTKPGGGQQPTTPIAPTEVPELPAHVNPVHNIQIEVSKSGVPSFVYTNDTKKPENGITVPSVVCLQKSPGAEDSQNKCETKTETYITTQLISVLGKDYVQQVLGSDWKEHYTTSMSFNLALLEKAQDNPKVQSLPELITEIKRYKVALKSVATYVFLPLIVQQQKIETKIVWSTFDYRQPNNSYIQSYRPDKPEKNMITLPLVNPKVWLVPVDITNPFRGMLPELPENSPYRQKLQPLMKIFQTQEIYELLGTNWNPSVYPNRGALFISVLRTLLTREVVKSNTELYTLVQNYLRAIELPSTNVHIPKTYVSTVTHQYDIATINPGFPIGLSEIKTVIPIAVNPKIRIQVMVSSDRVPSMNSLSTYERQFGLKNYMSMPSVTCLQQSPSDGSPQDKCEKDVDVEVTKILTQTFGVDYIQVILGNNWKQLYPTRVSLFVALLDKVETHSKIVEQTESVRIIRRYKTALKAVASYIFLPLAVGYQNINNVVVWLTYDTSNPSITSLGVTPPPAVNNNTVTLPLINPKSWLLPVDAMRPFAGFVPRFTNEKGFFAIKIQPLMRIIRTGEITKLLGVDWRMLEFPNRGALFVTVLHTLLRVPQVKVNTQLYTLLQQYLTAIELASVHLRISTEFIQTAIHKWQIDNQNIIARYDPIVANVTKRNDILLPAMINPHKDLQVIVKSMSQIFVEASRFAQEVSENALILPSVNCLQAFPDMDDDEYCENYPHLSVVKSIMVVLGEDATKHLLTENSADDFPTMAAFLGNFMHNILTKNKIIADKKLVAEVETFKTALEFVASSIFLPMLANYQKIEVELIWLTYDTKEYVQSQMSLHRSDSLESNIVTLPLVNPKIWLQSVNVEHPFSSFIPILPADDPFAAKIRPLTDLLNSGEILQLLGKDWVPANYPNRGSLFISALHTLLKLKEVQSNKQLHTLVKNYFNVIRVVSQYVHIPRSWINNGFTRSAYTWTIDMADLYTVLPAARTMEERRYFYRLQAVLQTQNLLQHLEISLPALNTYKVDFLLVVIKRVLASNMFVDMDGEMKAALEYYSSKAELALTAKSGVVRWIWVARVQGDVKSKRTLRIDIGKIFTMTIPISRLNTKEAKIHYFKLIKFMSENPAFLKTTDFMFGRYHNYGQFLRAYLNHLMRRPNLDKDVKTYMKTVVQFVRNTGPGALPINMPRVAKSDIR